jgi:hypothetical protein
VNVSLSPPFDDTPPVADSTPVLSLIVEDARARGAHRQDEERQIRHIDV